MDLTALKNRYWWSIDDSSTNPLLMDAVTLTALINDARMDMADRVRYLKYTAALTADASGIVTLPTDFIAIERITNNDEDMSFYPDIHSVNHVNTQDDDDDSTSASTINRYVFLNNSQIQLFDTPTNLLTANQSSAETSVADCTAISAYATLTRSTADSWEGDACIYTDIKGPSGAAKGFYVQKTAMTLVAGEVYTASAYVKLSPISVPGSVYLSLAESGDATASESALTALSSSEWTRITVTRTITSSSSTSLKLSVYTPTTETSIEYYADGLQLEAGATASTFSVPRLKLWYAAYPPALVAGTDTPSEIPAEYHAALVDKYVRAQHALKNGWHSLYQALSVEWEDVKNEVSGKTYSRTNPIDNEGRFEW